MKSLAGQAEERITDMGKPALDLVDRAGLRSRLAARLAGLATPNAPDVTGSLERGPNGAATTIPHLRFQSPKPHADAFRIPSTSMSVPGYG